jgi:hypothetical protein
MLHCRDIACRLSPAHAAGPHPLGHPACGPVVWVCVAVSGRAGARACWCGCEWEAPSQAPRSLRRGWVQSCVLDRHLTWCLVLGAGCQVCVTSVPPLLGCDGLFPEDERQAENAGLLDPKPGYHDSLALLAAGIELQRSEAGGQKKLE